MFFWMQDFDFAQISPQFYPKKFLLGDAAFPAPLALLFHC